MATLLLSNIGYSQISLIQDSKGETALENFNSTVNLNFGAEEISGKYFRIVSGQKDTDKDTEFQVIIGGGASIGAVKGKSVLFKDGELNSKGSGSLFLGGWISNTVTCVDWYPYISARFTNKSINLWDSTAPSIQSQSVNNSEFQIGITRTTKGYPIIAAAIKFGTTDNSSDLASGVFATSKTSASGSLLVDSKNAIGPSDNFRDDLNNVQILTDLLWIKGRIGIPANLRLNFPDQDEKSTFVTLGTGIFVNKSKEASNQFVGGLLIQDPDLLGSNVDESILKRLTITLLIGIPFGDVK